jgi:dienelactone hydrolase
MEMWHPDPYLEQLYHSVQPKYRFQAGNEAEWGEWRTKLKRQLEEDLGGFPAQPAKLDATVLEETICDGYLRQRVEFTTFAGLRMPAFVLVPADSRGKQLPAVVACHGHGYGSREIVGLTSDGKSNADQPTYQKNFAIELVKRGFVVIVPELLGFGDRRMKDGYEQNERNSCHSISTYLLQMGHTMAGHRVYETIRAMDYLLTRDDVDANRIGCMGISGGGTVTTFTSVLDDRVKAVVISGYVNTFKASILSIHHCVDNYVPGLVRHAEMPDIVGLIAPRPLLVEAGTIDPIFPIQAVQEALEQIGRIYRLLGQEDLLDSDIFEGDHRISGRKAYDWLSRCLG